MNVSQGLVDRSIARARRRLIPFLLLMYVIAFLDRANIGFAKEALQASAGISAAAYALGAGLFFVTYALFEIPSNLIMRRVGAKAWMCRIMVTWGLVSMGTMFTRGPASFYLLRLLLGAAEAGFFPGIILYLTYWFPDRTRGRIFGLFYFGVPLSFILGGPLSGLLLDVGGKTGLEGWQCMFLTEGLLAVAVGIWAYWYLDDRPADAVWLPPAEREALTAEMSREERERSLQGPAALLATMTHPRVLYFTLIYFLFQMGVYGVVFYLPAEVAAILDRPVGLAVGVVSALPWVSAVAATLWISRAADRYRNHRSLAAVTVAVAGLASAIFPSAGPPVALLALSVAASGIIAAQPLFWTFPTGYLAGNAAAGGIAMINALGNLGGFLAPNMKVWADGRFASPRAGLYLLAGLTLVNAGLIAGLGRTQAACGARAG